MGKRSLPMAFFRDRVSGQGNRILNIMTIGVGLGETGESCLVGHDFVMRSNSRFEKDPTIFKMKVETDGGKAVFEHHETHRGVGICRNWIHNDYRGVPVLSHNHYLEELDVVVTRGRSSP